MTVTTFIDHIIGYVSKLDSTDADNDDRRALVLAFLEEIVADVWAHKSWWFKRANSSVTITANAGYSSGAELASDFSNFGPDGGVYDSTSGAPLEQISQQKLADLCEGSYTTNSPQVFALFGQGATYGAKIRIPPNPSAVTLDYHYESEVPTLDESSNVNNLKKIPEQWHFNVLVPGVRYLMYQDKGDARTDRFYAQYQRGLAQMVKNERWGREQPAQLPGFFESWRW